MEWKQWCNDVRGKAINGGHFFPEEDPESTAQELNRFFASGIVAYPFVDID